MSDDFKPRLCNIVRGAGGYGFHLHGEKGKTGQHIRKVEQDSAADLAGLKEGDRIIEVNGKNVEEEEHHEVVARIKEKSGETTLLVVDAATDQYFKDKNIPITEELLITTGRINDESNTTTTDGIMKQDMSNSTAPEQRPRLCHLVRGDSGFGFNLHSEKGKQGSFIRSVEPNGPSETAGLKAGDRIVEINGKNLEYEKHNAIVAAIKGSGSEVKMLVVDEETDNLFKELKVTPAEKHVSGPLPTLQENPVSSAVPENVVKEVPKTKERAAPAAPAPDTTPATNGAALPEMDLAALKEKARSSSRKKAPQSNWNNRQAIFNNL